MQSGGRRVFWNWSGQKLSKRYEQRAKDSTCIESFKKGQGLLKSIPERCDTKKPHKNKQDYRKVVLAWGECRSTDTGVYQREKNNRLAPWEEAQTWHLYKTSLKSLLQLKKKKKNLFGLIFNVRIVYHMRGLPIIN